jgi:hypothetical protein
MHNIGSKRVTGRSARMSPVFNRATGEPVG